MSNSHTAGMKRLRLYLVSHPHGSQPTLTIRFPEDVVVLVIRGESRLQRGRGNDQ